LPTTGTRTQLLIPDVASPTSADAADLESKGPLPSLILDQPMAGKVANRMRGYSRRRLLGTATARAGGAVALRIEALLGVEADSSQSGLPGFPGSFGRMFPTLTPFAPPTDAVKAALLDIGKPGGVMDAMDALAPINPLDPNSGGPLALITNLALSIRNPNNPTHSAGTTFMGQFMDHDMTFDAGSPLGRQTDPTTSPNSRRASFDLDSVYGLGPVGSPQLFDPNDSAKFVVGFGGTFEDLPRQMDLNPGMRVPTAVIGDPRNDENLIIAGLHAAFLKFHNRVVDYVRAEGVSDPIAVFLNARLLTTWHYQWMIVHEFLPLFVGQPMVDDILNNGPQFFDPARRQGFIPVEFETGMYRFGHSMVRPSYRANLTGDPTGPAAVAPAFFGLTFDSSEHPEDRGGSPLEDPNDMTGGFRAPRRFIGWRTFFNFDDGEVKPNKKIDTTISSPLFALPLSVIPPHTPPVSLPQRNLLRHLTWSLPSGQAVAKHMGVPVLSPEHFSGLARYGLGLERSTPLWFYVLAEAELTQNSTVTLVPSALGPPGTPIKDTGLMLGPVGGRIVGEVILALLRSDRTSYISAQPGWQPIIPTRAGRSGTFRMIDFLTYAGVDAAR
jgi:Animal haem peroxidase